MVIGLTHVGLGPHGELGLSLRRQQDEQTPTCGALQSVLATWEEDPLAAPSTPGLADHEAQMLRNGVDDQLNGPPTDILDVTFAAADAVEHEMGIQLEALAPWDRMDAALFTGVLIHMPEGEDLVVPIAAHFSDHTGRPRDLELPAT